MNLSVKSITILSGVIVANANVLPKNKDKFGVVCVNAMTSVAFVALVNTIVFINDVLSIYIGLDSFFY